MVLLKVFTLIGICSLVYVAILIILICTCISRWRLKLTEFLTWRSQGVVAAENALAADARRRIQGNVAGEECPICLGAIG